MTSKPFYLTTTLPYVNAPLHMGHALEFVRADAIARYKKLAGYDVYFNTGTDEHGMKIFEKAEQAGQSAQDFVDASFLNFKKSVEIFGLSDDIHYIRTTDKKHEAIAQDFWMRCFNNGYIYKKNYQTKYCVGCESEKTDSDLVNGECPDHPGRALEIIEEENYFFKYSAFTDKLLELYKNNPTFVVPDFRFNEIKAFVERGLQDFSISRLKTKMPWGIPVPNDSEHVMYVWFDALTNYISTLASDGIDTVDALVASDTFQTYWVNGTPTQYCGKDNLRFQSAMWQAMLLASGLPNSHQIVINGFITADGGLKMSKTLGNVVDPKDIVEEFGTDALRYFLLGATSSFEDSPFTLERFRDTYNGVLVNSLGNLVSRLMTMAVNYEVKLEDYVKSKNADFVRHMEEFDIKAAVQDVWNTVNYINGHIQETEPFKKIKTNPEEAKSDIAKALKWLMDVAMDLRPLMPDTSEKIINLIKANKKPETPLFLRK